LLEELSNFKRIQYINDCIIDMQTRVSAVLSAWDQYRDVFVQSQGNDVSSSLSILFNQYLFDYERLKRDKFALPAGYTFTTNLLYTRTGKLITVGKNTTSGNFHYFEWDYDNAVVTPDINSEIINSEFVSCRAIMSCDCEISIVSEGSTCENYLFIVETVSPFSVIPQGCLDDIITPPTPNEVTPIWSKLNITNVTQQASCVSKGTNQFGTTTTTTTSPATTTTTTSIYLCYGYEVVGPQVVWYSNCVGDEQAISVPTGETLQFCSSDNTITGTGITLLGACPL
jgi:hypothetical protein